MISPYTATSSNSSSSSSFFKKSKIGVEETLPSTTLTVALPILGIPKAADTLELRARWRPIIAKYNERSLARQLIVLESDKEFVRFTTPSSSSSSSSSAQLTLTRLPRALQHATLSFTSDRQVIRLVSRSWRYMVDDFTLNEVVLPLTQSIDYLHHQLDTPDLREARNQLELIVKIAIKGFRKGGRGVHELDNAYVQHNFAPHLELSPHNFQLCQCHNLHPNSKFWSTIRFFIKGLFIRDTWKTGYVSRTLKYPQLIEHSDKVLVKFMLSLVPPFALSQIPDSVKDFEFLTSLALYNNFPIKNLPTEMQSQLDFIKQVTKLTNCHSSYPIDLQVQGLIPNKELILNILNNYSFMKHPIPVKLYRNRGAVSNSYEVLEELLTNYPTIRHEFYQLMKYPKLIKFIFEYDYYHRPLSELVKDPSFISKAIHHPDGAHILEFAELFADNLDFYRTACLNSDSFLKTVLNGDQAWSCGFGSSKVHAALKKDPQIMLKAAQLYGVIVFHLNPDLINNLKIVVAAAKHPNFVRSASDPYKKCRELVVKALAPHQNNIPLMIEILKENGFFIEYIALELRSTLRIILAAVPTYPQIICYYTNRVPKRLEAAPKIDSDLLEVVKIDLETLQFKGKITPEICLQYQAAKINPKAFQFIDEELRRTRAFVADVVSRCGAMLQFAAEEFRSDPEIVSMAIQNDTSAINFALGAARVNFHILRDFITLSSLHNYRLSSEDIRKSIEPHLLPHQKTALRKFVAIFGLSCFDD